MSAPSGDRTESTHDLIKRPVMDKSALLERCSAAANPLAKNANTSIAVGAGVGVVHLPLVIDGPSASNSPHRTPAILGHLPGKHGGPACR